GRLSTTNQPRSSRHLAAVLRPAPDSPVTTATSTPPATGPAGRAEGGVPWVLLTVSLHCHRAAARVSRHAGRVPRRVVCRIIGRGCCAVEGGVHGPGELPAES